MMFPAVGIKYSSCASRLPARSNDVILPSEGNEAKWQRECEETNHNVIDDEKVKRA